MAFTLLQIRGYSNHHSLPGPRNLKVALGNMKIWPSQTEASRAAWAEQRSVAGEVSEGPELMPTRRAARSTGLVGQQLQPPHLRTCISSRPQARGRAGPPLPSRDNEGLCVVTLTAGGEATVPSTRQPAPSSAFIYLCLQVGINH